MLISQLPIDGKIEFGIQMPNTDAIAIIRNEFQLKSFITAFGDQEIIQGDIRSNWFTVPAFAKGREIAMASKAIDCARWGCE